MSKKLLPILCSYLLYKTGNVFLDTQFIVHGLNRKLDYSNAFVYIDNKPKRNISLFLEAVIKVFWLTIKVKDKVADLLILQSLGPVFLKCQILKSLWCKISRQRIKIKKKKKQLGGSSGSGPVFKLVGSGYPLKVSPDPQRWSQA